MRGVWVPFDRATINAFYQIPHLDDEEYQRLNEEPNYMEIIKCLSNGQGQWKVNSKGKVVNFKVKYLTYVPKTWHHLITSKLLPSTNVCEVTKENGSSSTITFFKTLNSMWEQSLRMQFGTTRKGG